jgi:nitrogen fixation protein NifU and related proteins
MKSEMYSKEVMKHFLHPKSLGKIKNPSGEGSAGNMVCLLPEEKIHKNSDCIEIRKLKEQQKVLTHTGNYKKIIVSSSRNYNGKIITLKNKLGKISLTPEHLVYAISIPKKEKFLRNKNKRKLNSAWYHVEQLKKGDIILYPKLKVKKNIESIEIDIPKRKWDFKSKEIPKKVSINSDLLRLFGYFLSEGNIQDKPCRTFISFTLNIKEKEIVEDIKNISKLLFGLDVKIREKPERKSSNVYLYNAKLARFFKELFGNGAEHKKIPNFIMNLPAEKQKSLIFGLWKGDGYVNLNRNGPRAGYSTISYQLTQQIKTLLLRQDIVPSIYVEKEKETNGVNHKKSYRIHIGQRDSLKKLCEILKTKYSSKSYASIDSWFDENYLYTPITDIRISNYLGKVNNLEVENSHSFVSEAFCVHNCGDVMQLFIKVKEDKKTGKKIISDIKFQTFGCVVAIANSSMVTTMVKGKTIDQALKITKDDVLKKLGKVPPIKIHCSVLAIDALDEAIYDYLKKKNLSIPEKLRETHERIQNGLGELEHRHREYFNLEKEVYQKK